MSRIRRHAPNGAIVLNVGMRGVIADVITHAIFCQLVHTPQNSIGTAVLMHCDLHTM